MQAFIINLESARDRWASVERAFAGSALEIVRVPGVDGHALQLPIPEYAEGRYRWLHGRPTSPGHVGCYLSHVRAMEAFLATEATHALIGEDDLTLGPDIDAVIAAALTFSRHWNLVRLTGLGAGAPKRVAKLFGAHFLCVNFGRLKGTGAYLIDRKAAAALATGMLPMWLPIDHAMDREWWHGLRALSVFPFPASQLESGFRSSIHRGKSQKLPAFFRWIGAYPYQAGNETARFFARAWSYLSWLGRRGPSR